MSWHPSCYFAMSVLIKIFMSLITIIKKKRNKINVLLQWPERSLQKIRICMSVCERERDREGVGIHMKVNQSAGGKEKHHSPLN